MFGRRILHNRVPVKTARLPRRMRSLILFKLHFADFVLRYWRIVRKCRKLAMNLRRAEIRRILKRDLPRAERLVENRQRKLARPGLLLHHKFVQAGTRAYFETNVLDINDLGFHRAPLQKLKNRLITLSEARVLSTQPNHDSNLKPLIPAPSITVPSPDRPFSAFQLKLLFDSAGIAKSLHWRHRAKRLRPARRLSWAFPIHSRPKMKRVSEVLQFSIVIKRCRLSVLES